MQITLTDSDPESLQAILARMERTFFPPDPPSATPITPPAPPLSQTSAVQIAIDVEITTDTPATTSPQAQEPAPRQPAILFLPAPRLAAQEITAIVPDPLPVADLVEVLPPLADPVAVDQIAEALPAPAYTNGFTRPYKNPDLKLVSQNGNGHPAVAEVTETIHPELNFEKHASLIFAPAHSKNLHKPRSRTWIETLPDGNKVKSSIIAEPYQGQVPTTKTRKVLLALQKVLETKGWDEEEKTLFSTRELANTLGVKWHGSKTTKELYDELDRLRLAPFRWQHAFVGEDGATYSLLDRITILDTLTTLKREARAKDELFRDLHVFRFSEPIRKNLKANRTKPTNLDVALRIRGELASVLYAQFDVILATKEPYKWQERNTEHLFFDDLKLDGKDYHKPSVRKRFLQKALNELQDKPISTGILDLKLTKTTDGKDWKLVYRKLPLADQIPKPIKPRRVPDANPPEAIPFLINDIEAVIGKYPSKERLFTKLLKTYSTDLIYQAISEYRADTRALPRELTPREPIAYFQGILHRLAHQQGKSWIKPCDPTCKYLPQA